MSTNNTVTPEQGLSIEKLRHLETYFQTREQEDASRASRRQIAARIHQINAELRVIDAGRAKPAEAAKKGDA